jgi:hypothetical protein
VKGKKQTANFTAPLNLLALQVSGWEKFNGSVRMPLGE